MTFRINSLGLVVVLWQIIVPTHVLRKFLFICVYLRSCLWHLALDMWLGQCIRDTWLFFLCFHENCLSVVITSCIWDVVITLCFRGASVGSTLLTLAFPCINGVTKVTQHHLCGYGHPKFYGWAARFNPSYVDFFSGLSARSPFALDWD
jgi:hypothetical protein